MAGLVNLALSEKASDFDRNVNLDTDQEFAAANVLLPEVRRFGSFAMVNGVI
jgi:hypothetical protein